MQIPQDIKEKLLPYQIPHVDNIIYTLNSSGRCLDASDTGTGKTYTAAAACKILKLKPLIICPKSVISSWVSVLKHYNTPSYGIANYELIQNCKYYTTNTKNKLACPYIKRTSVENIKLIKWKGNIIKKKIQKNKNLLKIMIKL